MIVSDHDRLAREIEVLAAENRRLRDLLGRNGGEDLRAAAAESEHRRRAIFNSTAAFAMIVTDREGRITDWNDGADDIVGWTAAEVCGRGIETIFTPEDRAARRPEVEMDAALREGRSNDERWHLRKDGSCFFAAGEMLPLRDCDERHVGFIKVFRDRTAGHRAGKALKDTETLLRRAQEVGGVGVFNVDLADDTLYGTPEFCRLYGLPKRVSFPCKAIEELVHPEDAALRSGAATRRVGNVVGEVTYRIRRADDGAERWIARSAEIERDGAGRPARFVGTVRDITDQVLVQHQLVAEREQLAQLFEQAQTFMALLRGPGHRIERVNPGYTRLIGGRDVVGATVAEALPEAVEQGFLALLDKVYRTGEPFSAEAMPYIVVPQPGLPAIERYIDFVYQPLRESDGAVSGIFVEGVDVTARTLAAAELREDERRQARLLQLADEIRDMSDPAELAQVSSRLLAETLGVSRVGYGTVDKANETIVIDSEWDAPGVTPLAGTLHFRDYGSYIEDLKRGETVAIGDADGDARTQATAAALRAIHAQSFVNMPLVEHGSFVALLYVNHAAPRHWSESDIRFMRDVGERVRIATERLRSERALRDSEEQFRVFAQAMPNQIWASGPDGRLDWFNQQAYLYAEASPGALEGVSAWADLVHPDDLAGAAAAWTQALATGEVYETEFRIRRADGVYRWFLVRAEPVRDGTGAITRWVGSNTDIDDRRQQAAELERLNTTLEQEVEKRTRERDRVWSSTNDLMATAGLDGFLKTVNPAWTRMLGWDDAELLAKPFFAFIDPADHAETIAVVHRLRVQRHVTGFVDRVYEKNGGQRTIMWEAAPDGEVFQSSDATSPPSARLRQRCVSRRRWRRWGSSQAGWRTTSTTC